MAILQETCGCRLHYQRQGRGEPVLLLHSSACTGGSWRGLLTELGAGFSFYTPDLADYGQSSCEYLGDASTLRDEAEFVGPLMWDRSAPFHLIGHSFGGAVALAAALAWPDRVRSLTLYEPTAFFVLRERMGDDRRKFDVIRSVADDMRQAIAEGSRERAMARFVDFWNEEGAWERLPASQRVGLGQLADTVVRNFRVIFDARYSADDFRRLRFPVTIIRGDRSPPVALRVAERLVELIPDARLVTLAGANHMAPVTAPKTVAPAMLAGLAAQAGDGGDDQRTRQAAA